MKSATLGIKNKSQLYKDIDEAFKIQDAKERSKAYQQILKQVDDEGVFIPITHGRMTVVAPKDLQKLSLHNHNMSFHLMKCNINKGASSWLNLL